MDPDITGVGDIALQDILVIACSIRMRCGLISTCLFYLALIPLTVIRAFLLMNTSAFCEIRIDYDNC